MEACLDTFPAEVVVAVLDSGSGVLQIKQIS